MSYETEYANITKPTNVISAGISAALVQAVVVVPHVHAEPLPVGTMVKLARKAGYLTAASLSESSAWTYSAENTDELKETSVTVTAAKTAAMCKVTVEAQDFTSINLAAVAAEEGRAIARILDDNVLTLFSALNGGTAVTSSSTLTVADIMQAAYLVRANLANRNGGNMVGIFDYKGVFEIQKELIQSGGAALANRELITLLTGLQQLNGYVGSVPGVDIFATDGLTTGSSDDYAAVFNPEIAFFGMYSPAPVVKMIDIVSGGFWTEIGSYVYSAVAEWNDGAGICVKSDT